VIRQKKIISEEKNEFFVNLVIRDFSSDIFSCFLSFNSSLLKTYIFTDISSKKEKLNDYASLNTKIKYVIANLK
jgi:hypothetical protein